MSESAATSNRSQGFWNSPGLVVLAAFAMRITALAVVPHLPTAPDSPIWRIMGGEMVNVAASLAADHGFSSPFGVPTGPTAWIPPIYPYLLAGIFRVAGTRSTAAWYSIMLVQTMFSSLTCWFVYRLASRALGSKTAVLAAWTWALFPYAVVIPVLFIWETTLSALLLSVAVLLSLDLPDGRASTLVSSGVVWGLAALTSTSLLAVMPFALFWPYRKHGVRRFVGSASAVVGIAFLVVLPWLVRNFRTFGVVMPVRSNFAEQLWLGNHAGGKGRVGYGMYPLENSEELERYRQLGEVAYEQQRKREALLFIAEHPGQFLRWILYRAAYWWFGLGESAPIFVLYAVLGALTIPGAILGWRRSEAQLLVLAVLVFPAVYYLTDVYARYRHPVEPFMVILSTYAIAVAVESVRGWKKVRRTA